MLAELTFPLGWMVNLTRTPVGRLPDSFFSVMKQFFTDLFERIIVSMTVGETEVAAAVLDEELDVVVAGVEEVAVLVVLLVDVLLVVGDELEVDALGVMRSEVELEELDLEDGVEDEREVLPVDFVDVVVDFGSLFGGSALTGSGAGGGSVTAATAGVASTGGGGSAAGGASTGGGAAAGSGAGGVTTATGGVAVLVEPGVSRSGIRVPESTAAPAPTAANRKPPTTEMARLAARVPRPPVMSTKTVAKAPSRAKNAPAPDT